MEVTGSGFTIITYFTSPFKQIICNITPGYKIPETKLRVTCPSEKLDAAALIARLVLHLFQGVIAVVASWDMKMVEGILIRRNAGLKCAVSGTDNWRPVPIAPITPLAL